LVQEQKQILRKKEYKKHIATQTTVLLLEQDPQVDEGNSYDFISEKEKSATAITICDGGGGGPLDHPDGRGGKIGFDKDPCQDPKSPLNDNDEEADTKSFTTC